MTHKSIYTLYSSFTCFFAYFRPCWWVNSPNSQHQASSCERMHNSERWWGPQRTKLCKYGHWVKSLLGKFWKVAVKHRDDWHWPGISTFVDGRSTPLSSKHLYGYSASSSAWDPWRFHTSRIWQKSPLSQKFRQLTAWKLPSPHHLRAWTRGSAIPGGPDGRRINSTNTIE